MRTISKGLTKAKNSGGIIPDLNGIGPQLVGTMSGLLKDINPGGKSSLKSSKVYTE